MTLLVGFTHIFYSPVLYSLLMNGQSIVRDEQSLTICPAPLFYWMTILVLNCFIAECFMRRRALSRSRCLCLLFHTKLLQIHECRSFCLFAWNLPRYLSINWNRNPTFSRCLFVKWCSPLQLWMWAHVLSSLCLSHSLIVRSYMLCLDNYRIRIERFSSIARLSVSHLLTYSQTHTHKQLSRQSTTIGDWQRQNEDYLFRWAFTVSSVHSLLRFSSDSARSSMCVFTLYLWITFNKYHFVSLCLPDSSLPLSALREFPNIQYFIRFFHLIYLHLFPLSFVYECNNWDDDCFLPFSFLLSISPCSLSGIG